MCENHYRQQLREGQTRQRYKKSQKCERAGCDEPIKAHGICQRHYDRERAGARGKRKREDRVLTTRARNRALAALVKAHKEEFDALYVEALAKVQAEDAELRKVAKATESEPTNDGQVLRLKRGPAADDEDITDRIDMTPRCEQCETYHSSGHECLHCGALPSRVIYDEASLRLSNPNQPILVPADMTDERIKAAVDRGKRLGPEIDEGDDDADVG